METAAHLAARLHHLHELGEVVGAMRSMAAGHVQQARAHLTAIHAYTVTVEQALSRVAATQASPPPSAPGDGAVLLLGGEHGFCGDFAERLADELLATRHDGDSVYVVGSRSVAACEERGMEVSWRAAMVSHADGVLAVARDAVDAVYEAIASGRVRRLSVLYGEARRAGGVDIVHEPLLPFEMPADGHGATLAPLVNLPPALLVERLVDEFVMARVVHAGMESLAAENTARLFATTSASAAIDQHVEALEGRLRRERQEAITSELAELVAGGAFTTR